MKTKDFDNEKLYNYFADHVRYEIQMLLNATDGILQKLPVPQGLESMCVESYAIHLRNLITFFYSLQPRDTDVHAKDFFVEEGRWVKIRPKLSEALERAKTRADKEISHLTTSRQSGTPESKVWDVRHLSGELMVVFKFFCESADKVKLVSSIEDILTHYSRICK